METIFFTFLIIILIYKLNFRLIIENLALRQQLAIMKQSVRRPKIRKRDRLFWIILSRLWNGWKNVLIVVQPETVIRWHRKGFKLYWKSKSQKAGRPPIEIKVQRIVKKMIKENPLWGAPTLHGELIKLGIVISERTVSNMIKRYRVGNPPSQTWRTFLKNHMNNTYAIDFFTVPTANFKILYVFVILWHERRKVVHFNVTLNPTAQWTAQQIVDACPWDTKPKYLLRDRDGIYGKIFQKRIRNMGIEEVKTSPHSPWQNPYCERFIGSIRRSCLNHMIVLNEKHLKNILSEYFKYYHHDRTHLGLSKNTPFERQVQFEPKNGILIFLLRVGGLHHRYIWKEAA
ncbi:MAG: transposase [Desulfobacula sp.]|jgi:transposase InsO family protein|nr:transposase [Desulfobacula sp.]MBT3806310.1 transposase [Desulfobacula sp.]MBT4025762.1 transposase [Desulfobacula sp.]MBT4200183.1 transposase [Desulfobacula sp.]MBT4507606.1 transposase [Desulfobacula sp.]